MPLTGTVDVPNASIHLHVDYTGTVGTQINARVFRMVGTAAAPREYVRGMYFEDLLGEEAYLTDTEAPLDTEIWYEAIADDDISTQMLAGPFTIPSQGYVWLKDPGRPWADLKLDLCAEPTTNDECPATPPVLDTFERTETDGWGTADTGQAWTTEGGIAAQYSVSGGEGHHSQTAVTTFLNTVVPSATADVDIRVDWSVDTAPVGASNFVYVVGRYTDTDHFYAMRVQIPVTGTMTLTLRKRDTTETQLAGLFYDTTMTFVPGQVYSLRFQISGSTLRMKMWRAGEAEPGAWQFFAQDTTFAAAGSTGVRTLVNTGSTTAFPVVFSFDNYSVTDPNAAVPIATAWVGFGDKTRPADSEVFHVLGRETPTAVYASRKDLVTSCRFLSRTLDAIIGVHELFIAGSPLLIQTPDVYGMVPYDYPQQLSEKYWLPADLEEQYLSIDQRKPWRLWDVPLTAVTNPVGTPQGTDTGNWCALEESYFTYADMTASGYTWAQAMSGEASVTPLSGLYGGGTYGGGFYGG